MESAVVYFVIALGVIGTFAAGLFYANKADKARQWQYISVVPDWVQKRLPKLDQLPAFESGQFMYFKGRHNEYRVAASDHGAKLVVMWRSR